MHEIRIKLPPELHQKWSNAAYIRGLSVTAFIVSTVSNSLLASGELHQNSTNSGKPVEPIKSANTPQVAAELFDDDDDWGDVD
jgi:hypothetical protein